MEEREYNITVFTENYVGLLNRITIIFTRRHINIESLTVSASELPGIHRFTIVVNVSENMVKKVVKQINKQVEVLRASYYTEDEIIYQEVALYKVPTQAFAQGENVETLIRRSNARILEVEPEYIVIEKTGHKTETHEFFEQLKPYGVLQFARSGRVAITKHRKEFAHYLQEMDEQQVYSVINHH